MAELSILGVILAAVVNMILGMIWYHPKVFGQKWMDLLGFKKKDLKMNKNEMRQTYAWAVIMSLATAWVLAYVIVLSETAGFVGGAFIGFLMWLGFVMTTSANEVLWAKRHRDLYWLNNSFHLVSFVVMGGLLGLI